MTGSFEKLAIIADDDATGRLLLAEACRSMGVGALAFEDGQAACHAAQEHDVALVMLDVDMPVMDGFTACQRLRADPRLALVPIVMVTSHDDEEAIAKAFQAGATDFITKPVNWALLPRRLEYILRNAAAAEHIRRLAYQDTLTGLPNRQSCLEQAERLFAEAALAGESVAVIYLDLNGFKKVNDTFGHSVGDGVLCDVSRKLRRALAPFDDVVGGPFLARFGGDEFVLLTRGENAQRSAENIAAACVEAMAHPVAYDGLEFYSTPSIGIAVYPDDGPDVTTVLKHADVAMYQAKSGGSGSIVAYRPVMSARLRDWLELEGRLRRAVRGEGLYIAYQPKFNIASGCIVGAEALLRWQDPDHGDISPSRFIDIAEESGLIVELGNWVIRAVCRQMKAWRARGIDVAVAINVSGRQLLHGDPARVIQTEAAAAGISPSSIEVEITESVLIRDAAPVHEVLNRLRALGCRIALDDFGTGYSSLAYITRFPLDRIKIDQAFVQHLDRSAGDAAVATAILSLGESLGMTITAEGVERLSQLEWLTQRGCHEAQGFLLSRPLTPADLERQYLVQREAARAEPGRLVPAALER